MFEKVLVANRGEIAVRVMRTLRELGIRTVAVYSEPDREALHVRVADEAYCVGPAASAESYLRIEKIIEVARAAGVDAIHPGYGFLSERSPFAKACKEAGITFIGPEPYAIDSMGDKTRARGLMKEAGVPLVPGTKDAIEDPQAALGMAREMGFPVLIKASAGGGGKGMRRVDAEEHFVSSFEGAKREAWEEARARIEIDCLLAVYEIPRISQVQLIYRARLRSPDVEPGPESLEVGLFRWDEIPWESIAFPTVHWALDEYDKRRREHEFSPATNPEPEPPPPVGL